LHVSTWKWHLLGPSPVWLTVLGASWHADPTAAKKQLAPYEANHAGTVHQDHQGYPTVMLRVPVGADRVAVIGSVLDQLREIGDVVVPLGLEAKDAGAPPDEGLPG
jgi:hypothetical protein